MLNHAMDIVSSDDWATSPGMTGYLLGGSCQCPILLKTSIIYQAPGFTLPEGWISKDAYGTASPETTAHARCVREPRVHLLCFR